MLQEAIDLQQSAVSGLVAELGTKKKEVTFKAPTGSGKTYMMADLMNRVLAKNQNVIFLVSSLSKGDLAQQNYDKFEEYKEKGNFSILDPYLINTQIAGEERLYVPTDHNVYVLPRDLYKKGGRLMQGAMVAFLDHLRWEENKIIFLIKDECHIATKNLDNLSNQYFSKIINFSATPVLDRGQHPDVEIKKEDAENVKLIKTIEWGPKTENLKDAIGKFESIKEDYRNLLGVNPCLIIQISNKDKADEEVKNTILPVLNETDLKWMLIVDEDKLCETNDSFKAKKLPVSKWKDYAKNNTSAIDVIIFKMVISEGWDIPRACMLFQIRDSQSKQLDEQVSGRVRRNPRLLDFETLDERAQELAMTAWVWGIAPEEQKKVHRVKLCGNSTEITDNMKVKTTRLKELTDKEDFNLVEFLAGQEIPPVHKSIFEISRQLKRTNNQVRDLVYEYATDFLRWWEVAEFVTEISKENDKYRCDYEKSMEICDSEVSFPMSTHYTDNGHYVNITDWIWKRFDGAEKFSFDSEAERDWADILKDLSQKSFMPLIVGKVKGDKGVVQTTLIKGEMTESKIEEKEIYLWGKNYLCNSTIKFEYYLNGIHSSFPDFIMKDCFGRIHIFEVKSINVSSGFLFDSEDYKAKIEELKRCYKQASLITDQIFYLPIVKDDIWHITQFYKGDERTLTKEQLFNFVKNNYNFSRDKILSE